jgi:hypothetical protein
LKRPTKKYNHKKYIIINNLGIKYIEIQLITNV